MSDKVYLVYAKIPTYLWVNKFKYLVPNETEFVEKDNHMVGVYGWTTRKDIKNEFIETRSDANIFKVVKHDNIDDDLKQLLVTKLDECQIEFRDYSNGEEDAIIIPTTKFEYVASTFDGPENLAEFNSACLSEMYTVDYKIFSDKMRKALEILDFPSKTVYNGRDDEEADLYEFNKSYGLTISGYNIANTEDNEYNTLITLYDYMFLGYSSLLANEEMAI